MKSNKLFDHEKFNFNIARLKKAGRIFEVVIDSDLAIKYKEGDDIDLKSIIKSPKIFSNANHGMLASEQDIKTVFKTDNIEDIAKTIIKDGEIHLTAEYRNKVREMKRKQIVFLIHKNSIDPRTNAPHTIDRIEWALEQKKVKIDEFKKPQDQLKRIIDEIKTVLPLKFENKKYSIKIYPEFAAKGLSLIQRFSGLKDSSWLDDGSVVCLVELSPGVAVDLIEKLNQLTKGTADIKILE